MTHDLHELVLGRPDAKIRHPPANVERSIVGRGPEQCFEICFKVKMKKERTEEDSKIELGYKIAEILIINKLLGAGIENPTSQQIKEAKRNYFKWLSDRFNSGDEFVWISYKKNTIEKMEHGIVDALRAACVDFEEKRLLRGKINLQ